MKAEVRVLQDLAELCDCLETQREHDAGEEKARAILFETAVDETAGGDIVREFGKNIGEDACEKLGRESVEDVRLRDGHFRTDGCAFIAKALCSHLHCAL